MHIDKSIQVQYCSSELAVGTVQQFKIYEGIGRANAGVRFHLNLVDGFVAGDLRCFESQDCDINFLDIQCDTIIEMDLTSTTNLESSHDINLYPNPIQDELYLDIEGQDWEYQIFNLQGQQMLQGVYQDYIHVNQLPGGIYFLYLRNEDILYQALKFVKE